MKRDEMEPKEFFKYAEDFAGNVFGIAEAKEFVRMIERKGAKVTILNVSDQNNGEIKKQNKRDKMGDTPQLYSDTMQIDLPNDRNKMIDILVMVGNTRPDEMTISGNGVSVWWD
jgi:hypothetical protein